MHTHNPRKGSQKIGRYSSYMYAHAFAIRDMACVPPFNSNTQFHHYQLHRLPYGIIQVLWKESQTMVCMEMVG